MLKSIVENPINCLENIRNKRIAVSLVNHQLFAFVKVAEKQEIEKTDEAWKVLNPLTKSCLIMIIVERKHGGYICEGDNISLS